MYLTTFTDHCLINRCKNGGTCVRTIESYNCICTEGYHGEHCRIPDGWFIYSYTNQVNIKSILESIKYISFDAILYLNSI